jgi:hypothetical protein
MGRESLNKQQQLSILGNLNTWKGKQMNFQTIWISSFR